MTEPDPTPAGKTTLPSITDAVGGPLGMVESALPTVVFIAAVTATGKDIKLAAILAVVVAVVMAVVRLGRGQTIRFAVSGLVGVAFAAFVAAKTGRAENFFLPGLLFNAGYAALAIGSIVARRPLAGYAVIAFRGGELRGPWHTDARFTRVANRATWVLALVFLARIAVQLPLYLADALVALGVAKVAMGLPLFAVGLWVAWLVMRGVPVPDHAAAPTDPVDRPGAD